MAISITQLTKWYNATRALNQLSLTVPNGAIFGLLGPNGSGKSTLLKLIMGFMFADEGTIDRAGFAPSQIGYVAEWPAFPVQTGVAEYLATMARLCGQEGAQVPETTKYLLNKVGLSGAANKRIGACSQGMQRRLSLAVALIGMPPLLLLDEPMNGLDPVGQQLFRELLEEYSKRGSTILLCTHRLSDVDKMCTHVGIMKQGQLLKAGPLAEVLPLRNQIVIEVDEASLVVSTEIASTFSGTVVSGTLIILVDEAVQQKQALLHRLVNAGVNVTHLNQQRSSLEEVYMTLLQ